MSKFIDANIVLRFLLNDVGATKVERLLRKEDSLYLADIVLAEIVWTLNVYYKKDKKEFISQLKDFLLQDSIKADKKLLLATLEIYEKEKIDYIDAYLVALMKKRKERNLYSFDRHFDRIFGIRRIEPK